MDPVSELTPHLVAVSFYNGEMEDELRVIGMEAYIFKQDADRENCMEIIDESRRHAMYAHKAEQCTDECKKRGRKGWFTSVSNYNS